MNTQFKVTEAEEKLSKKNIKIIFPNNDPDIFINEIYKKKHFLCKASRWHQDYNSNDFIKAAKDIKQKDVDFNIENQKSLYDFILNKNNFSFRLIPYYKYTKDKLKLLSKVEFIEETFGAESAPILFFSKENNSVLQKHWDTEDLIICQISGRKRWFLYENKFERPLRNQTYGFDNELCKLEEEPYAEFLLEEGDILYLPKGIGHKAVADSTDSIHITYGLYCPSNLDILKENINITLKGLETMSCSRKSFSFYSSEDDLQEAQLEIVNLLYNQLNINDKESILEDMRSRYLLFNDERFEIIDSLEYENKLKFKSLRKITSRFVIRKNKIQIYGRQFTIPFKVLALTLKYINNNIIQIDDLKKDFNEEEILIFLNFLLKLRIFKGDLI